MEPQRNQQRASQLPGRVPMSNAAPLPGALPTAPPPPTTQQAEPTAPRPSAAPDPMATAISAEVQAWMVMDYAENVGGPLVPGLPSQIGGTPVTYLLLHPETAMQSCCDLLAISRPVTAHGDPSFVALGMDASLFAIGESRCTAMGQTEGCLYFGEQQFYWTPTARYQAMKKSQLAPFDLQLKGVRAGDRKVLDKDREGSSVLEINKALMHIDEVPVR